MGGDSRRPAKNILFRRRLPESPPIFCFIVHRKVPNRAPPSAVNPLPFW